MLPDPEPSPTWIISRAWTQHWEECSTSSASEICWRITVFGLSWVTSVTSLQLSPKLHFGWSQWLKFMPRLLWLEISEGGRYQRSSSLSLTSATLGRWWFYGCVNQGSLKEQNWQIMNIIDRMNIYSHIFICIYINREMDFFPRFLCVALTVLEFTQ